MKKEFTKLNKKDQVSLMGFARYMGYEFDYNPEKSKSVLITTDNEQRNVLYLSKINGKIIGIDSSGNVKPLNSLMNITRELYMKGIFKMPEKVDIGINEFILDSLKLIGAK